MFYIEFMFSVIMKLIFSPLKILNVLINRFVFTFFFYKALVERSILVIVIF